MSRVLIIGYGNPLRCDDGLGWRAAEALSRTSPDVEVITSYQLTPEFAEPVSQADMVVFIDAAQDGDAGSLRCRPVSGGDDMRFSHQLSSGALLAMAEHLYHRSPRAFEVSVCGGSFAHGETFSPAVQRALPELIALVEKLTARALDGIAGCHDDA